MTFKQKYIHEKGPFPFDFQSERTQMFSKIVNLLQQYERNIWIPNSFNLGSIIQNFKQVYGFKSIQIQTLIMILANIFFEQSDIGVQPKLIILKLLNRLLQQQIEISDNFTISNQKLMSKVDDRIKNGSKDPLKHQDTFMEEFCKFILEISKYGEDYTKQAMQKAIWYKNTRILVLFIGSIKSQQRGQTIINELLKDSSLWQRDVSWWYVISEIVKKYPKINFSNYYVTIFQQVIKIFTTMLDPVSNQQLKKLTERQPCLGIRSILKSTACLLVNLVVPHSFPQSQYVWNAIERIFNIITTTLDHINQPTFIFDQLHFMRAFAKYFIMRYRNQRKIYLVKNEDFIEDFHGESEKQLFIDEQVQKKFNNLWPEILPKILFYEQQQSMSAKIIVDLAMYDHQFFMPIIINSIKNILTRDDLNMISIYTSKMSILFLYDFVFIEQPKYIPDFIQIFRILLDVIQKLGIAQNLDVLELVFRAFLYMNKQVLDNSQLESIIQDSLQIILKNLDTMSASLQDNSNQQSELYVDLANIFFPFLIKLDKKVLTKFMDKFAFKLLNEIPEHTDAYEHISIICSYIEPKFTQKIFKQLYSRMITIEQQSGSSTNLHNSKNKKAVKQSKMAQHRHQKQRQKQNEKQKNKTEYYFFQNIPEVLSTKNENQVKWYTQLIQCLYQYHPENVVRDWQQIQKIIICLFKQTDNTAFMQTALDMIFNLILCLCHFHFDWTEFTKPQNNDYRTLNIKWNTGSKQVSDLLLHIYDKYFIKLCQFMKNRYGQKVASLNQQGNVKYIVSGVQQTIQIKDLRLIDSLLTPQPSNLSPQFLEQKKLIYRVFSLQYTVLSALMIRAPIYPGVCQINDSFFKQQAFKDLRKTGFQYGQWICDLMRVYNILWQPNNIKLFNYFWRQTLDEVYFTAPLASTVQKLSPYYYSQIYRKKQLLRTSYLILNQVYTIVVARQQFLLQLMPVAYLNNQNYIKKQMILNLNHQFDGSYHSIIPSYVNMHQYHHYLMLLCRFHIDCTNKQGYAYKYINATQKRQKEKYLVALKMILANIKKSQNPINYQCCIKDPFMLESIISSVQLFKTFQNKIDKMLAIDLFYLMMVFGFDCNIVGQPKKLDLKRIYQNSCQQNDSHKMICQNQFLCHLKNNMSVEFTETLNGRMDEEKLIEKIDLKMKRTSSFRSPEHISVQVTQKIQEFIESLLNKLNVQVSLLDKDSIIYCLMMIIFSKFLLISNSIFGRIIKTLIELTKSQIVELFDVSKTGLFHIINRFNSLKRVVTQVDNTIVKRPFQDFLVMRYLGGQPPTPKNLEYYSKVYIDKNDNFYYPISKLLFYQYQSLGADPDSDAIGNQQVMLKFLTDHEQLKRYIISCSHDKDLKQQETQIDTSFFDQNTMGITANGHKLLNFLLDSNPKKNDIFAPFLQNFSLYPISFYPRMLRKLIRMGNQETLNNLIKIAEQLRQSNQIQQKKMSLYISCEIIFVTPIESQFTKKFINYLATCPNDVFEFGNQIVYLMFTKNFVTARKIYEAFIKRFREQKGTSRLRHLTLMNLYLLAQGRFSRQVAIDGIKHLMKGIQQGSNQVSQVIITMIVSCFVIAINLQQANPWISESIDNLIKDKKIYKLNQFVGYEIDDSLKNILGQIVARTKVQNDMQAKNLKIYSKIANKILSSISVYRYNDSFYQVLRQLIFYVVQKVPEEGQTDEDIILQLKDSEYPQNIYKDLLNRLLNMTDNPQSVIKKKLKYIQSLVINQCYSNNKMQVPQQLLQVSQKIMSIDFVISVSNMYRLMTRQQTIQRVETEMKKKDKNIYNLMALLLSAGVREYEWKEEVLKQILKSKKLKIVKQFISYWWKGKNPETPQQKALQYLVQGVQNPYSYFA